MKLKHLAIASMFAFAIISCKQSEGSVKSYTEEDMKENPLVQQSSLPYFAPEFDKIKIEHFKPALEYGLQLQSEAIEQIVNNPEEPTFENTLVALEKSGEVLSRASRRSEEHTSELQSRGHLVCRLL